MKVVVQRVRESSVSVGGSIVGRIGPGVLVLLGVAREDEPADADYLADKIANLRIFEDDDGRMNWSLLDTQGEMLVVSQFTLLGDCRKGRRPSFIQAARPEVAERLYTYFTGAVRKKGLHVATGQFQAMMAVTLVNDGPVTLVLDSPAKAAA